MGAAKSTKLDSAKDFAAPAQEFDQVAKNWQEDRCAHIATHQRAGYLRSTGLTAIRSSEQLFNQSGGVNFTVYITKN